MEWFIIGFFVGLFVVLLVGSIMYVNLDKIREERETYLNDITG